MLFKPLSRPRIETEVAKVALASTCAQTLSLNLINKIAAISSAKLVPSQVFKMLVDRYSASLPGFVNMGNVLELNSSVITNLQKIVTFCYTVHVTFRYLTRFG